MIGDREIKTPISLSPGISRSPFFRLKGSRDVAVDPDDSVITEKVAPAPEEA